MYLIGEESAEGVKSSENDSNDEKYNLKYFIFHHELVMS